ncbi:MAG: hypothetical protein ACRDE5_06080 [Ginsengibacter sp.]
MQDQSELPEYLTVFNNVNITNLRIIATVMVFVATAVQYLYFHFDLDPNWLVFLGSMAGVDTAHYFGKRATFKKVTDAIDNAEEKVQDDGVMASSDISEYTTEEIKG